MVQVTITVDDTVLLQQTLAQLTHGFDSALDIHALFTSINNKLEFLLSQGATTNMDLSQLQAAVERATTVQQSAKSLIQQIAQKLNSIAGDQQAVRDFAASLNSSTQDLSDAVTANTVAENESPGAGNTSGGALPEPTS